MNFAWINKSKQFLWICGHRKSAFFSELHLKGRWASKSERKAKLWRTTLLFFPLDPASRVALTVCRARTAGSELPCPWPSRPGWSRTEGELGGKRKRVTTRNSHAPPRLPETRTTMWERAKGERQGRTHQHAHAHSTTLISTIRWPQIATLIWNLNTQIWNLIPPLVATLIWHLCLNLQSMSRTSIWNPNPPCRYLHLKPEPFSGALTVAANPIWKPYLWFETLARSRNPDFKKPHPFLKTSRWNPDPISNPIPERLIWIPPREPCLETLILPGNLTLKP